MTLNRNCKHHTPLGVKKAIDDAEACSGAATASGALMDSARAAMTPPLRDEVLTDSTAALSVEVVARTA